MKLVWMPQALEDLQAVRDYIATDNPAAANRMVITIATLVRDMLTEFPGGGRQGRVEGTRELVVPQTPFIVPYRVKGGTIEVLGVHHAARRWPESF